jgi:hypothetical protein
VGKFWLDNLNSPTVLGEPPGAQNLPVTNVTKLCLHSEFEVIINPKHEARNSKQKRFSPEYREVTNGGFCFVHLFFDHLDLFRISDFEFLILAAFLTVPNLIESIANLSNLSQNF